MRSIPHVWILGEFYTRFLLAFVYIYTFRGKWKIGDAARERVGKVHLGVVHLWDVEFPAVQPRETDIVDAGFVPLKELLSDLDQVQLVNKDHLSMIVLFGPGYHKSYLY